jgi:BASS family bile acid:Na+ symporter
MALAADKSVSLSMSDISLKLLLTVVGPVAAGNWLIRTIPSWEDQTRRLGTLVANLAILWIITVVVGKNRDRIDQVHFQLLLALVLVNVCGYIAGFLGGRAMGLPIAMRRALTLEVGMQNAGLGTWLAMALFPDTTVAIAPAIYTFGCMLTGTLLANVWSRLSIGAEQGDKVTR